jgi:hypothetical protein
MVRSQACNDSISRTQPQKNGLTDTMNTQAAPFASYFSYDASFGPRDSTFS